MIRKLQARHYYKQGIHPLVDMIPNKPTNQLWRRNERISAADRLIERTYVLVGTLLSCGLPFTNMDALSKDDRYLSGREIKSKTITCRRPAHAVVDGSEDRTLQVEVVWTRFQPEASHKCDRVRHSPRM